jgi:tetratricopeptide (TPR) repeat protein
MVRLWYLATAAWMQHSEHLNRVHLDRAREIFPRDADILFLLGCLHETFADAQVQATMQSAVLPTGIVMDTEDERAELRQAEEALRRAVETRPDFPEAHLRLGRVLALRGRYAEGVAQLREALAPLSEAGNDPLRYYGELFLGAAEELLSHFDEANAAYTRAAALFPKAQSPLLGLSELARRRGDRRTALAVMQQVFDLPREEQDRLDPWWTYHVYQARNADERLDALWKPFRDATK